MVGNGAVCSDSEHISTFMLHVFDRLLSNLRTKSGKEQANQQRRLDETASQECDWEETVICTLESPSLDHSHRRMELWKLHRSGGEFYPPQSCLSMVHQSAWSFASMESRNDLKGSIKVPARSAREWDRSRLCHSSRWS
ncbi:hypothetical protein CERZMDRAFT_83452 [Cercospora zeae-maydis SCOH1-5]|uniref:Uncharacterized protein n=1 Tax=Cercospora zeae-maydis SCOH1-5 TaxID=717836 RepID=A0A6A6FL06_9PEZI|nr:hypothetical protein CERZMDRAFT_83452 [Cercospora zeae-maydis SCOH1-5]